MVEQQLTIRLPDDQTAAIFIGRVYRPDRQGPSVVAVVDGRVRDITSPETPTARDLCERADLVAYVRDRGPAGEDLGPLEAVIANSDENDRDETKPWLLAPIDLQAVKAAGVTFATSLLERVIEEQARGAPDKAAAIRAKINDLIGADLSNLTPGSAEAMAIKDSLIARDMWSQYLEVGIGPDAEIFTKAQPLASVGAGAHVGLHPLSTWNNPEPEIVLVMASSGAAIGATLGNDVNLRDVEGRSALLLGKAKDNNASSSLGPFIRLFDDDFTIDDIRAAELTLTVRGADGFEMRGHSNMSEISRDPLDIAAQAYGKHHQYPDGFVLFLGTMFAPIQDRDNPGEGFTHKTDDVVDISTAKLGTLSNRVKMTHDCAPWTFGTAALMRNLARRGLL